MQEDQDLRLWTQGPHKNLTTSIPSNASNGIHHQHIKDFTHEPNYPSNNQSRDQSKYKHNKRHKGQKPNINQEQGTQQKTEMGP